MTPSEQIAASSEQIAALAIHAANAGKLSWDLATAITQILKLQGNEAMLAARLLGGGADPASLVYLADGNVPEKIQLAHENGPSVYSLQDDERSKYLTLCAFSQDEAEDSNLRGRVLRYAESLMHLGALGGNGWTVAQLQEAAQAAEEEYLWLDYETIYIEGQPVRCYVNDFGHAAAVWDREDPQTRSAVYGVWQGEPYVALAAPLHADTLEEQGFDPQIASKEKTSRFWIIEDQELVSTVGDILSNAGMVERLA